MLGYSSDTILVRTGTSTVTNEVLQLIEVAGRFVRVLNSIQTYKLAGDKWSTYIQAVKNNIQTPKTVLLPDDASQQEVATLVKQTFSFPVVIKGINGARGEQVFLCKTDQELLTVLSENKELSLLAQEYIPSSYGKDIRDGAEDDSYWLTELNLAAQFKGVESATHQNIAGNILQFLAYR